MRNPGDFEVGRQERGWGDSLRMNLGEECLSAEDLVAFVDGRLDEAGRMRVVRHLGHCMACRDTVFVMRAADRAAQPRVRSWQKYAPGLGLAFGLAAIAGAAVIGTNLWSLPKNPARGGSLVAINKTQNGGTREFSPPAETSVKPEKNPARSGSSGDHPPKSHSNERSSSFETKPVTPSKPTVAPTTGRKDTHTGPSSSVTTGSKSALPASSQSYVANTSSFPAVRALKYYLVGQNHVYKLDGPEAKQPERQKIEQDYADNVAAYQGEYKRVLENGEDPVAAADDLKVALQNAAVDRDDKLSDLYPTADELRQDHPELQVDGDAPYQVVEVNYHQVDSTPVVDNYVVYAPWPVYVVDEHPYGWQYWVAYKPDEFHNAYAGWHRSFVASGRAFCGLRSHYGRVEPDLVVRKSGPKYGLRSVPISRYARVGGTGRYQTMLPHSPSRYETLGSGLRNPNNRYLPGYTGTGPSRYSHVLGPTQPGGASKYSRPQDGNPSRYNRGTAPVNSPPGGRYMPSNPGGPSRYNRGTTSPRSGTSGGYGGTRQSTRPPSGPGNRLGTGPHGRYR
jgi:hypothetical protein